ncbi:MAG: restriction endonuclease [Porphyromonadaceae bacterium]|nr:restriction endonuclease [Porphyromonadaceae bacterium]
MSIVIAILYIFIGYIVNTVRGRYLWKVRSLTANYEKRERTLAADYEKKVVACEKREKECAVREHKVLSSVVNKYPFQGLAEASADLKMVMYDEAIRWLENKSRPAYTSAEVVKELRGKTKVFQTQYKLMLYKYEFLLNKFPELEKYVETIDEMKQLQDYTSLSELEEDYDRTRDWLTREEYERLSVDARNQLALDNYIKSFKKSNWQIGRDYELYIGYLYRKRGWTVVQFGIEESLGDMGRDIIASDGTTTHIVQCKCWSTEKVIHENVICQLYGTAVQYELEALSRPSLFMSKVMPVLFSTTALSDTAQRFADRLGVEVRVVPMSENYPRIKCNINNGSKIYHLPFDQQYDRVKIDKPGEFYAQSVQEATAKGFRRAFRFTGLKGRTN